MARVVFVTSIDKSLKTNTREFFEELYHLLWQNRDLNLVEQ